MRENKIYPGHWRDFVSYILFEPIGFIYAGGPGVGARREGVREAEWRATGKGVSLFSHLAAPPRPFAVRRPRFIVYLIPRCLSPSRSRGSCRFKQIFQRQRAARESKGERATEKRRKRTDKGGRGMRMRWPWISCALCRGCIPLTCRRISQICIGTSIGKIDRYLINTGRACICMLVNHVLFHQSILWLLYSNN